MRRCVNCRARRAQCFQRTLLSLRIAFGMQYDIPHRINTLEHNYRHNVPLVFDKSCIFSISVIGAVSYTWC